MLTLAHIWPYTLKERPHLGASLWRVVGWLVAEHAVALEDRHLQVLGSRQVLNADQALLSLMIIQQMLKVNMASPLSSGPPWPQVQETA